MSAEDLPIHLRIPLGEGLRFGPGKAELLTRIRETGSVTAAAAAMGMSYRRAWSLVAEANKAFRAPLVELSRGGEGGGGARLTKEGEAVLASYRALESLVLTEGAAYLAAIRDRAEDHRPAAPRRNGGTGCGSGP